MHISPSHTEASEAEGRLQTPLCPGTVETKGSRGDSARGPPFSGGYWERGIGLSEPHRKQLLGRHCARLPDFQDKCPEISC